jgi:hypothetical protein
LRKPDFFNSHKRLHKLAPFVRQKPRSMSVIAILQQSMAGYLSTTAFKAFRQL